jgi:hypothetical protein
VVDAFINWGVVQAFKGAKHVVGSKTGRVTIMEASHLLGLLSRIKFYL